MTAGTSTTLQELHLRHLQTELSGPSGPVVAQQRACPNQSKNCTCGISTDFCTVCAVYLSLWRNQNIRHSVEELSLRHLHVLDEELLELGLRDHRDVRERRRRLSPAQYLHTALGWRSIPEGAAERCVLRTRQPPVHPPPRCEQLTPRNTSGRGAQREEDRLRPWHVHQLFHHLQLAGHGAQRDPVVEVDRGHSDNLLDRGRLVEAGEDLHHHVHHLRHRSIKNWHPRHRFDKLLHEVPLDPLLWTRHGRQTVWSGATGGRHLVNVRGKVLGACRLGRGAPGTWPCTSPRTPSPALAIVCLRRAEWCVFAARAWAIDCCSCLQAARSRRPLRRWAAPVTGCQLGSIMKGDAT